MDDRAIGIFILCFLLAQVILSIISQKQQKKAEKFTKKTRRLLNEAKAMNETVRLNIKANKKIYEDIKNFAQDHGLVKMIDNGKITEIH